MYNNCNRIFEVKIKTNENLYIGENENLYIGENGVQIVVQNTYKSR